MEIDKVKYYLELWTEYMKHGGNQKLGYPNKSVGFYTGSSHSTDELAEDMDVQHMLTVDSAIDDLPDALKDSVYATHLGNKINMTMMSIAYNYQLAVAELATKLDKKHLI